MSRVLGVRLGLASERWGEHHHTRTVDKFASLLHCNLPGASCPAPRMSLKMHQRRGEIFGGKACAPVSFYLLRPDQDLSRLRTVPGCNQPIPTSAMATHLRGIHGGARRPEPGALFNISSRVLSRQATWLLLGAACNNEHAGHRGRHCIHAGPLKSVGSWALLLLPSIAAPMPNLDGMAAPG